MSRMGRHSVWSRLTAGVRDGLPCRAACLNPETVAKPDLSGGERVAVNGLAQIPDQVQKSPCFEQYRFSIVTNGHVYTGTTIRRIKLMLWIKPHPS